MNNVIDEVIELDNLKAEVNKIFDGTLVFNTFFDLKASQITVVVSGFSSKQSDQVRKIFFENAVRKIQQDLSDPQFLLTAKEIFSSELKKKAAGVKASLEQIIARIGQI